MSINDTVSGHGVPLISGYFTNNSWNQILLDFVPVAVYINKVVTPVWYIIGIFGNIFSFFIWISSRMRKSNSSAYYLAALSLSDLFLLLFHIVIELRYTWSVDVISSPGVCEVYMVLYLIPHYLSALLVLGFTTERYIAVCHPFKKEVFCTKSRALVVICGLLLFSFAFCCIQGYFWEYNFEEFSCEVRDEAAEGLGSSVWSVWTWMTDMLFFAVVPIAILILNLFVVVEICRVSRYPLSITPNNHSGGGQNTTTVMLLTVSFYMIFTLLPATIVYSMSGIYGDMNYGLEEAEVRADATWQSYFKYYTVRKCVEELCMSHYAVNFFIYMITGKHFRDRVKQIIKRIPYISCRCHSVNYRAIPVTAASKRLSLTSQTQTRVTKL